MEPVDKKKKIQVRIGNVFCIERPVHKMYFQFIGKDSLQLNSHVIRVFKTKYPLEANPAVEDIINDDVAFYAHTFIWPGISLSDWHKVGNSKNIGNGEERNVIFCTCDNNYLCMDDGYINLKFTDSSLNWRIWTVNGEERNRIATDDIRIDLFKDIEPGMAISFNQINVRIDCGYYTAKFHEYNLLKRIPWPDFNSYTKLDYNSYIIFTHYLGENLQKAIVVEGSRRFKYTSSEKLAKDFPDNPISGKVFGDINWNHFISEEEFQKEWEKPTSLFLGRLFKL